MILLNLSHPLSSEQVAQVEALTKQKIEQVISVAVQFEHGQSFEAQLHDLMSGIELTPAQWQMEPILLNLPSFHVIAALVLADLHGRMGYFPPVLRLKPVPGSIPTRFEAAEIISLQAVRDQARKERRSS
jgi:hypothetical protein